MIEAIVWSFLGFVAGAVIVAGEIALVLWFVFKSDGGQNNRR